MEDGHDTVENLQAALVHRDLFGQAKGILMERHKITADEAWAMLVEVSNRTNVKALEVAERLIRTGQLDEYHDHN